MEGPISTTDSITKEQSKRQKAHVVRDLSSNNR